MDLTSPRFTNKVSPEFLHSLDQPHFSPETLETFTEEMREFLRKQDEHRLAHPAEAIHRLATEGSRTLEGGVIRKASSGVFITLANGQDVGVARVGDLVEYPDGSSTAIRSQGGDDRGQAAVVGSRLANGDEIIDTPQDGVFLVSRRGEPVTPGSILFMEDV